MYCQQVRHWRLGRWVKEAKLDTELDTTPRSWRSTATVLSCTCLYLPLSGGFGRACLTWQEMDTSNGNGNEEPTVVVATVPSFPEGIAIHLEEWESLVACGG